MPRVIVTGSQGYEVVGIDNFSKYGKVERSHDSHPNFTLLEMDIAKKGLPVNYLTDYLIAGAAMIGGISYFHKYAYDLLATNERIVANTFDSAIEMHKNGALRRVVAISSSMVYEGADNYYWDQCGLSCWQPEYDYEKIKGHIWPTHEGLLKVIPSPNSTYGFQKLAMEYFCKGANEQYGLPYTIVRPFNCVGIGEEEALGEEEVMSGNVKLMMSHVLPDLINKCLSGQDPLHILGGGEQVRCYTNGKDIASGIVAAMESNEGINQDFNISIATSTTVLELAQLVWSKINPDKPFRYISDKPYTYDVQRRIPSVDKAKDILGFEAQITLEQSVHEVISWMKEKQKCLV